MYFNELVHTGVAHDDNPPGRGSGRWAYGSGENPYQHQHDFLTLVNDMKHNGSSEKILPEPYSAKKVSIRMATRFGTHQPI